MTANPFLVLVDGGHTGSASQTEIKHADAHDAIIQDLQRQIVSNQKTMKYYENQIETFMTIRTQIEADCKRRDQNENRAKKLAHKLNELLPTLEICKQLALENKKLKEKIERENFAHQMMIESSKRVITKLNTEVDDLRKQFNENKGNNLTQGRNEQVVDAMIPDEENKVDTKQTRKTQENTVDTRNHGDASEAGYESDLGDKSGPNNVSEHLEQKAVEKEQKPISQASTTPPTLNQAAAHENAQHGTSLQETSKKTSNYETLQANHRVSSDRPHAAISIKVLTSVDNYSDLNRKRRNGQEPTIVMKILRHFAKIKQQELTMKVPSNSIMNLNGITSELNMRVSAFLLPLQLESPVENQLPPPPPPPPPGGMGMPPPPPPPGGMGMPPPPPPPGGLQMPHTNNQNLSIANINFEKISFDSPFTFEKKMKANIDSIYRIFDQKNGKKSSVKEKKGETQTDDQNTNINTGKVVFSFKIRCPDFEKYDKIKLHAFQVSKIIKYVVELIYKMTTVNEEDFADGDLVESVHELLNHVKTTVVKYLNTSHYSEEIIWEDVLHCLFGKENRYRYTFEKLRKQTINNEIYTKVTCTTLDLNTTLTFTRDQIVLHRFHVQSDQKNNGFVEILEKDCIYFQDSYYMLSAPENNEEFEQKSKILRDIEDQDLLQILDLINSSLLDISSMSTDENHCKDIIWPHFLENNIEDIYASKTTLKNQYEQIQEWIQGGITPTSSYTEKKNCFMKQFQTCYDWYTTHKEKGGMLIESSQNFGLNISPKGFISCRLVLMDLLCFWMQIVCNLEDNQEKFDGLFKSFDMVRQKLFLDNFTMTINKKEITVMEGINEKTFEWLKVSLITTKEIIRENPGIKLST
ncbi:MAG: hypothetical protein EBR09_15780 [Proteobacteria bacterium]|jgi:hypothetical protein|nr:hypothetical protein [Pseudomonadota bacterium]